MSRFHNCQAHVGNGRTRCLEDNGEMPEGDIGRMITRRSFGQLSGLVGSYALLPQSVRADTSSDVSLEIALYTLEASPKHHFRTLAYNGQVPGPLFACARASNRARNHNRSGDPEIVHWHGLFLPPEIDGAMEEGTPMIDPGASVRYAFKPDPSGFRWYHTHTFAGKNLTKAQYGGLHGFVMIEARDDPGAYDRDVFLALHDWGGQLQSSDDGSMNPVYEVSTINGKMLGFGEPVRVKQGDRVLMHLLNSSPTEVHWVALAGHTFQVVALDGNPVPQTHSVPMLRLAPAERVSAIVEMINPGVWILGDVRKHIQAAGMGIVVEYAGATGKPVWRQRIASIGTTVGSPPRRYEGSRWNDSDPDRAGIRFEVSGARERRAVDDQRQIVPAYGRTGIEDRTAYRLIMKNLSMDDHPMHLHRHTFEVPKVDGGRKGYVGCGKSVLVPAKTTAEVEFLANHPGRTLFHCHQQDHMDRGFMMVFRYA